MTEARTASGPWIAVIDDDEDVRNALGAILTSAGYAITCYENAEAFMAAPTVPRCLCIVSDVQMPGIGGIELARRLKAAGSSLPVILVSAFAGEAMRRRAHEAGAVILLEKPFDPENLLRLVEVHAGPA